MPEYNEYAQHYITIGTPYSDAETTWRRYEYLSQQLVNDLILYTKEYMGLLIFLTKRNTISFVLHCVGKENNTYLFTRYMIPHYNRYEADIHLNVPSDAFEEEYDVCSLSLSMNSCTAFSPA